MSADVCLSCVELLETVLNSRPILGGTDMVGARPGGRGIGHVGGVFLPRGPLTTEQKLAWVARWLPRTAAVMDLNGVIAGAQREPAGRA